MTLAPGAKSPGPIGPAAAEAGDKARAVRPSSKQVFIAFLRCAARSCRAAAIGKENGVPAARDLIYLGLGR